MISLYADFFVISARDVRERPRAMRKTESAHVTLCEFVLSGPILDRGSAALLAFFPMVSGPESQTLYLSGRYPIIGRSNRPTRGAGVAPRSSRRSFKPLVLSRCSEAFRSACSISDCEQA